MVLEGLFACDAHIVPPCAWRSLLRSMVMFLGIVSRLRPWAVAGFAAALVAGCAAGGDASSSADDSSASASASGTGGAGASSTNHGGAAAMGGSAATGGSSAANGGNGGPGAGAGGAAGGAGPGPGGAGGDGPGGAGGAGGAGGGVNDPPGTLAYEKVLNNSIIDNLGRVRWHPSGAFALVLGTGGKLVRYDAGGGVTLVDTLGVRVDDLDVAANGSFFMVVGMGGDSAGRMWRVSVDGMMSLTVTEELTWSFGEPRAIERNQNGTWAVGAYSTISISFLYLWQDGLGITSTKGFNASAGFTDLMWGDPLPLASEVVHTGHGWNGTDSRTYVQATDSIVPNAWPGGFGNAGGAGWRPGGTYGYFTGSSSNKLYVYDGGWMLHTLPGVGTAAGPQAIGWNAAGTRALIVGRAIGPGLSATVIDHRAGTNVAFGVNDLVKQSIPNFDLTPWFGTGSSSLMGVDWRPNSACAEGLIAGTDNGTIQNPTFGLLVRFYDATDPDCP